MKFNFCVFLFSFILFISMLDLLFSAELGTKFYENLKEQEPLRYKILFLLLETFIAILSFCYCDMKLSRRVEKTDDQSSFYWHW